MDRYDGFREFVLARSPALVRTAYLLTGDQGLAEDLVQSSLAKTAARWSRIATDNPEAYVRRVLHNEFVSAWRWRRRRVTEVRLSEPVSEHTVPDPADGVVRQLALRRALDSLSPGQRAVVVLRFYEDRSEAQTAEILGCSTGTVKSQTHRALARLRTVAPELAELTGATAGTRAGRHDDE